MSTVIADSRTLTMVADKQMSGHQTSVTKIFKVKDAEGEEWLVGGTGTATKILQFVGWLSSPSQLELPPPDMEGAHILAMGKEGQIFFYVESTTPVPIEEAYFAAGSGSDYAMGALDAGASIKRALEIAKGRDPNTGNGTTLLKLRKTKV